MAAADAPLAGVFFSFSLLLGVGVLAAKSAWSDAHACCPLRGDWNADEAPAASEPATVSCGGEGQFGTAAETGVVVQVHLLQPEPLQVGFEAGERLTLLSGLVHQLRRRLPRAAKGAVGRALPPVDRIVHTCSTAATLSASIAVTCWDSRSLSLTLLSSIVFCLCCCLVVRLMSTAAASVEQTASRRGFLGNQFLARAGRRSFAPRGAKLLFIPGVNAHSCRAAAGVRTLAFVSHSMHNSTPQRPTRTLRFSQMRQRLRDRVSHAQPQGLHARALGARQAKPKDRA